MKYIPLDKQSKKAQKEYLKAHRKPPIPPKRVGKGTYEYKSRKMDLKAMG